MEMLYRLGASGLLGMFLLLAACAGPQQRPPASLAGEPRLRVAQAAEESGDFALAEEMYAAASTAAPADAAVQLRYADVLVRRGKVAQARDLLIGRLKTVSDTKALHDGLGSIFVLTGEPARAIAEFDAGSAADSRTLRAVVNKGVALDLLGRHEEAQAQYRQALAIEPGDPVVINDLALSMLLAGRAREAAEVAAPLREQGEMLPRIRAGLGVVLAASGDMAGARAVAGGMMGEEQLLELSRAARQAGGR